MDLATQTHLKTLREALVLQLQALRAETHAAAQARLAEPAAAVDDVSDLKDMAERRASAGLADETERRNLAEAEGVEAALRRLDAGSYGDCADCGEPIGWQRLLVLPAASRCARCQAAREHTPEPEAARDRR